MRKLSFYFFILFLGFSSLKGYQRNSMESNKKVDYLFYFQKLDNENIFNVNTVFGFE